LLQLQHALIALLEKRHRIFHQGIQAPRPRNRLHLCCRGFTFSDTGCFFDRHGCQEILTQREREQD